jgi:phosphogluconate dehydratase
VNDFHAAGGIGWVIGELLETGRLHRDVLTVASDDLSAYAAEPVLEGETLAWAAAPRASRDETMLRPVADPFNADGGMALLQGNLGRAVMKTSAVDEARWTIEAPAAVFQEQNDVLAAFKAGELDRDVVVVVRFQGPRANGMPELHKLTPALGVLQDRGHKVALVTDGRMSGASGKVPAAIHLSPEALGGGPVARLCDGDVVRVCARTGTLEALVEPGEWANREPAVAPPPPYDTGRELFALLRNHCDTAEEGASAMLAAMDGQIGAA